MYVQLTIRIDGREVGNVEEQLSGTAAEVEEQTLQFQRRAGRIILEHGFDEITRHVGRPVCCGRSMENRGRRCRTIQTQDGEVVVERTRYRCRVCRHESIPADEQLCFGRHYISKPLAQRICQLATVEHWTRLERLVADQHGVHVGHEEMLELVHDAGGEAERQRRSEAQAWQATPADRRNWPTPEVTPRRIYVSCDGIMYCSNRCEPDPQKSDRRRLIWQQMKVGCVYWETGDGHWHKQLVWGRESPEEFGAALFRLACRCGYRQATEKIFAADGGDWCWDIHARYFPDAVGILDWFHASEHVWETAHALHADEDAVRAWAEDALGRLGNHGGERLVRWLKDQRLQYRRNKRQAVETLINYIEPRTWQTDYPRYRAADWQIGTGMIESTAKQLVGVRLKGPGMHWSERGALAITALRAHDLNGRWHSFWKSLTLAP
ncbi:MAG TPA: ISKra4 family transposase [Anaerolineales bacterium]